MTIDHMRTFLALAVLVGCNGHNAVPDAQPDAVTLDCSTYCREIEEHCTGGNAQYPGQRQCMAVCESFSVGTISDAPANTLGCRISRVGAASNGDPATYCAQSGPGGDHIMASSPEPCSGGDVCESFCTLQIKACGSVESPLSGSPTDSTGNPLFQYQNMENCMMICAGYDKTHAYSTASAGNSLACRLLRATSAAVDLENAKLECRHTGFPPRGPCAGTPTP